MHRMSLLRSPIVHRSEAVLPAMGFLRQMALTHYMAWLMHYRTEAATTARIIVLHPQSAEAFCVYQNRRRCSRKCAMNSAIFTASVHRENHAI
ncbi:jg11023 [Pararge aegeria aegeria]|uniref:Jg11023 protein n=1 Tax=Pararge aegeria aegeria TaxID=348720 RepID=A0A8S4SH95_9NEOP|nr:jg11023 [Pararge aegeria aegeria]